LGIASKVSCPLQALASTVIFEAGGEGMMFSPYETILLGEPDLDDVFFFKRTLQLAGVESPIQVVHTGPEVIKYLEGVEKYSDRDRFPFPSYVFVENYLPLLGGLEVIERVQHFLTFVPFVLFVEAMDFRVCERASELGVAACLAKPFQVDHLQKIRERIEH
jgi:CheY-like chemotaxis protein